MSAKPQASLAELVVEAPLVYDFVRAEREWAALTAVSTEPQFAELKKVLANNAVENLLRGIFSASPYLTRLIVRHPDHLQRCLTAAPDILAGELASELQSFISEASVRSSVMKALRVFKAQIALLTALADLGGIWPVMTVTAALSGAADVAVDAALSYLFADAQRRGDWVDTDPASELRSGYFILAMGKHGASELNYSSDIDLIVFYDPGKSRLAPFREVPKFFIQLTRDLVKFLQEPTEDGYVFRTDLRLRPDPGSTAVALSITAADNYYECVGQNWERAALIKARVIAGDKESGQQFLTSLSPFIWRKNLDFAAIADIHAMKRQIHVVKGFGTVAVAGHNIKVGRGGIREIEFFTQTQQLIAGGRQRDLRVPDTLGALDRLVARNWITALVRDELAEAYVFLRRVEHLLQMVADEQTQTLPTDTRALESLAAFARFSTFASFSEALTARLTTVQNHYSQLFEASPALTAAGRDMVFAGSTDDPATVAALSAMGFSAPSTVIECVRGWHHGRARAIRSPRARELLTEMQPRLIHALSATANPDQAFAGFDRFIGDLPSGVQLFSLLKQHPALLELVAAIMGTAPRLARVLSRRGRVLDAVLDPGFFGSLATQEAIRKIIITELSHAQTYEQVLDRARVVGSEQAFLIGVRVLTGTIEAADAGRAYAGLADELIEALAIRIQAEMTRTHGEIGGGGAAIVALGKLGGREMTAASDLDLMVIYDFDPAALQSNGEKPLSPAQYYARFTQRLIGAFSSPTAEGSLYEIDMRLRPSGNQGPVATQLSSFIDYQASEAWTWEHLALTRARVVAGPPLLRALIEAGIAGVLQRPRNRRRIAADVHDMRNRIAASKGTSDPWDLKQVRGGLIDIEFIAQYLQLIYAVEHPIVRDTNTEQALRKLAAANLLAPAVTHLLLAAVQRLNNLTQVLRLSLIDAFDPATIPDGLKRLLAGVGQAPTFEVLAADLVEQHREVAGLFDRLIR